MLCTLLFNLGKGKLNLVLRLRVLFNLSLNLVIGDVELEERTVRGKQGKQEFRGDVVHPACADALIRSLELRVFVCPLRRNESRNGIPRTLTRPVKEGLAGKCLLLIPSLDRAVGSGSIHLSPL